MQLPKLSEAELKEHLQQPLVAKLGTLNADGTIRITPLSFQARDDHIILITPEATPNVRNLKRNPQCSLLIDTVPFPSKVAHFYGRAEVDSQPCTAEEIGHAWAHYFGGQFEQAKQFGEQLISRGKQVFIRFYPERVRTIDFTKTG